VSTIQLAGTMLFGTSGAAADLDPYTGISKAIVHLTTNKVAHKPTYDDPRTYGRPGARADSLELVYESDLNVAAELWALMLTAMLAGTPLHWSGKYKTAAASATNSRFTGSFYVTDLNVGHSPGEAMEHSHTFDLITFSGPLATEPA
jgi:hypothetical protein